MKVSLHAKLTLFPLIIRKDKKHFIVENQLSGDFFEVPALAAEAIEYIQTGMLLQEVEINLKKKYPNEEVDILGFAEQLLEFELVKEVDGYSVSTAKQQPSKQGFYWIPVQLGKLFFNPVITKLYLVLILINLILVIVNPQLIPRYEDIFIFDSMMLSLITYMGISLVLILLHEFGHILAIRAHGLPAKFEIGHRLFLVVFETDLTPAWGLNPKKRTTLYLAGIYFDQLFIFLAFVLSLWFAPGNEFLAGVLGIIVLDLFIKTIYQCCFYMKTDLYYVFENLSGHYNVMENSKGLLSKWLPFMKREKGTELFANEEKITRLYSVFYIGGVLMSFCLLVLYFLPQLFYAYAQTMPALLHPGNTPYFWDAVAFVSQTIIILGLLLFSWRKTYVQRKDSFNKSASGYNEN